MMASHLFKCLLIQFFSCRSISASVTDTSSIRLGLIQSVSEVVISEDNMLNLTTWWNRNNQPDIVIQTKSYSGTLEMKKLVKEDDYNLTAAYVSTDECSREVHEVLLQQPLPVVRINSDPLCDLNTKPSPNIITYPKLLPFSGVLHTLLSPQNWETVQVFYSTQFDYYVSKILKYFDNENILVKLFRVESNASLSYVRELIATTQAAAPDVTNNIILCDTKEAITLLQEADRADQWQQDKEPDVQYPTHWLVLCTQKDCPRDIISANPVLEYLAVLEIDLVVDYPISQRFHDVFHAVTQSNLMSDGEIGDEFDNATAANFTDVSMGDDSVMIDILKSLLAESMYSASCLPYTLYTSWWAQEKPQLVRQNLCARDGKTLNNIPLFPAEVYGFSGRYFRVYTIESAPFVYINGSGDSATFYGMCMEMLQELSLLLNFTYSLKRVPDGQFGGQTELGNWTGLVGMIQREEADLVVASLTASTSRDTVMDFVYYYYEYGGVLLKKPDENEDKWQVILKPFRMAVWLCLIVSVPLAGAVVTLLSTCFYQAYPGKKDEFVEPRLAMWYTFGALLTQGGTYLPRNTSSRYFICSWWAFSIIVVASYGGSLIAYLTISRVDLPVNTLEELVGQNRYKFGTKKGSFYFSEFESAKSGVKAKLYEGMMAAAAEDPEIISRSTAGHFEKVAEGNYAYITDKTPLTVQAISDKTCSLTLMKENFMPMPFGIGMQEGSPFRRRFEVGVKKLRQTGLLHYWEQKWWPKQECSGIPIPESKAITLTDTQSAFYLLLVGIVCASAILGFEWCRLRASMTYQAQRRRNKQGMFTNMSGIDESCRHAQDINQSTSTSNGQVSYNSSR